MKNLPLVSVVIPFYNCPYVGEAVESVLFQTYPNIEIVVVDDGSTRHLGALNPYLKHIRLVRKPNGGTASALNAGIRNARGEYIAWLSADDLFYTRKFAVQIPWMMSRRLLFSFTNFDLYILPEHAVRPKIMRPVRSRDELVRRLLDECVVNGCTAVFRRDVFERVGMFDESLPYTHDYDMWVRLALSDLPMPHLEESMTLYRLHPLMGSVTRRPAQMAEFAATKARYRERLLQLLK